MTYITNTSWKFSKITNTTGFKKSILTEVLRLIPDFINQKQFDRIYSIECEKKLLPTWGFVQVGQTEVQSAFCSLLGFSFGLTSIAEH